MFNWFKLNSKKDPKEGSWNPNTMTLEMQRPTSPVAPSTERVVIEQAKSQEFVQMELRGGGGACCGICAGLLCFECCECCC